MANMYNINALSYTPRENMGWFTRSLFGGRLIQGNYIGVLTGIKGEELLNQIDLQNKILQADGRDCAWTPNQLIKLSEKKAKVKTYKIQTEQCIDDLESKRTAYMLSPGARNESLPSELEEATLALISIGLSNEIEELIVSGDERRDPNEFDGLQTQLMRSNEAIKIPGYVLTKANIIEAVEEAVDALPENVIQTEDAQTVYIMMSYRARRHLRNALAKENSQVMYPQFSLDNSDPKNPKVYFDDIEVIVGKGMDANTIIVYDSRNVLFLTDLMNDLEDIRLGNFPAPKDNVIFIDGRLRLGLAIPFEDEIVIWSANITEAQSPNGNKDLQVVPNSLVFDVGGQSKTFNIITADPNADVTANASGSGYTVAAGAKTSVEINGATFGVTPVTVTIGDGTGSIRPRVGQVIVSIDDTDRKATVTLNQRNDDAILIQTEETGGNDEEPEA